MVFIKNWNKMFKIQKLNHKVNNYNLNLNIENQVKVVCCVK